MSAQNLDQQAVEAVADGWLQAKRVLFITGAGISAESGLPTYRGIGGLYDEAETEDNMPIEEALSGPMLLNRPDITWKHLLQIEQSCRGAHYNRAHAIIAELERDLDVTVLTQNVDRFHTDAGSQNVIDIHGDVHDLHCTDCTYEITVPDYSDLQIPPHCPRCHALMRPSVVLFGEMLEEHKLSHLAMEFQAGFDMVISIGTSSLFPYIAEPMLAGQRAGITTVEINPDETNVSHAAKYKFSASAVETLEAIFSVYKERLAATT